MGRGLHFVSSENYIAVMGFSTVILLLVGVAAFTQAKSVSKSATTEDTLKRLIRLLKGDKLSAPYSGYGSYGSYDSGSGNYDFSSSGSGDSYGSYSGSGDYGSGSYGSYSSDDYGSGSGSYGSYGSGYGSYGSGYGSYGSGYGSYSSGYGSDDYSGSGDDDKICIPEWVAYHIESMLWEHYQYVSGSGYGSG